MMFVFFCLFLIDVWPNGKLKKGKEKKTNSFLHKMHFKPKVLLQLMSCKSKNYEHQILICNIELVWFLLQIYNSRQKVFLLKFQQFELYPNFHRKLSLWKVSFSAIPFFLLVARIHRDNWAQSCPVSQLSEEGPRFKIGQTCKKCKKIAKAHFFTPKISTENAQIGQYWNLRQNSVTS